MDNENLKDLKVVEKKLSDNPNYELSFEDANFTGFVGGGDD